jgi:hypothetical protein
MPCFRQVKIFINFFKGGKEMSKFFYVIRESRIFKEPERKLDIKTLLKGTAKKLKNPAMTKVAVEKRERKKIQKKRITRDAKIFLSLIGNFFN